jgi:TnpA family transposase
VSFAQRFIGAETLPARMSEFDVQQFFRLSKDDISAICERFRDDRRVAAAIQLLFLRASGRPMDRFATVPKVLLRSVCEALGFPSVSIASLRSLYERRQTLCEHQAWARTYLRLSDLDEIQRQRMTLSDVELEARLYQPAVPRSSRQLEPDYAWIHQELKRPGVTLQLLWEGAALEGAEQHNRSEDRIRVSLLAVDTHGMTGVALAIAKLLGFDLCPRLKNLRERKLFVPRGWSVPDSLESATVHCVSLKSIERGWDDLV